MLGLGEHVQRGQAQLVLGDLRPSTTSRSLGPAKPSMPTTVESWCLASCTYRFPGTHDHIDAAHALAAVGERRDRLRAAHAVDALHAAQPAGAEDHRIDLAARAGRRAHGHVDHAGGTGGDHAHHDRAGIGRASAGHVHGGGGDGQLAQDDPLALGQLDGAVVRHAGLGHQRDVGDRDLQPGDQLQRQLLDRLVELLGRRAAGAAPRRRCRTGACSRERPASPSLRTRSMISRTAAATDSPPGTSARTCAAARSGPPRRAASSTSRRSSSISAGAARAVRGSRAGSGAALAMRSSMAAALSLCATGFAISRAVHTDDLLAHHEVVLAQRGAGGGEVDDRLHDAGQRGELDRALDLDDLRLAAGLLEVCARRCAGTWWRRASRPGGAAPRRRGRGRPCWPAPSCSARSRGRAARTPRDRRRRGRCAACSSSTSLPVTPRSAAPAST